MRARDLAFLILTMLAGLAAAVLAARGTWGVHDEWQWAHRDPRIIATMRWWPPVLPGLALICLIAWLLRRARSGLRVTAAVVLLFVLLAFILQVSTAACLPYSTTFSGAVVLSPVATTYFGEAGKVADMREFLAGYAQRMRGFSQHAQTYPPGPIVFFWAVRQAVEHSGPVRTIGGGLVSVTAGADARVLADQYARIYDHPVSEGESIAAVLSAWLLGLLGCSTIIPLYLLARDQWGDAAAIAAAALAATVPSLILFSPSISQLVTLDAALVLYLFHLAWSRRSVGWGAAAGGMFAIAALTSLAMLVMPLLLAAWAIIGRVRLVEERRSSALSVIAAWIGGSVLVFGLAYLGLGINFPAIMRSALGAHRQVTTQTFVRTYSRWLGWNLFDFWMFIGAALGLWLVRQKWTEWRAIARKQYAVFTPLLWALLVTIAVLDISGVVRAEVGRIWMFLMLPAAAAAGGFIASRDRPEIVLAVVLAAQLLQTWAFERYLALFVIL